MVFFTGTERLNAYDEKVVSVYRKITATLGREITRDRSHI